METSNDVIKVWNISKLEETLFTITLTSLSTPNLSMSNGHWFGIYDNSNNDLLVSHCHTKYTIMYYNSYGIYLNYVPQLIPTLLFIVNQLVQYCGTIRIQ